MWRPYDWMEQYPAHPHEQNDDTPSYADRCLLSLLHPVRHCLHSFISTRVAMRQMETSECIAASLLADYAFVDHVFRLSAGPPDTLANALYARHARHRMCILCMCMPERYDASLVDSESGQSLLPRSLVALTLGYGDWSQSGCMHSAQCERASLERAEWAADGDREVHIERMTARW